MPTYTITEPDSTVENTPALVWKKYQLFLFRLAFVYSLILIVPLDHKWFEKVFTIPWSTIDFHHVSWIANYYPSFKGAPEGIGAFFGITIALIGGLIAAGIWTLADRKRQEYNTLYYWLRVIIRYKLAMEMFTYSLIKVWPLQMPAPTISQLNTNFGDFNAAKLFWLTTGVSAGYQIFAGVIETIASLLLLYRKTTTIGALLFVSIMGPIVAINFGYDGGVQGVSVNLLILALILIAADFRRIWNFLVLSKNEALHYHYPVFNTATSRYTRIGLKTFFILFFFVFHSYSIHVDYLAGGFRYSVKPGLAKSIGFYNVSEYRVNDVAIPYSPTDSLRWQNVAFEKWNTISVKLAQPIRLLPKSKSKIYEVYGTAGRHYFSYDTDTVKQIITLTNQVDTLKKIAFSYKRPDEATLELNGKNEKGLPVYIRLEKIKKSYPLLEGGYERLYDGAY